MKHARSIRAALSLLLAMALLVGVVPVLADGINIIGTVTVTNSSYVNVRTGGATTYPVVATVLPGSIYPCIGTAPSGWYEILLDNGQTGFVSNNLTSFAPGGTGQYPGGQDTSAIRKTISVTYRTEAGAILATDYVTLLYGVNIVPANDGKVPAGYTLVSSRRVTVNVDWSGTATPSSVVFTYRPYSVPVTSAPQTTAQLPVYYRDVYGVTLNTQLLSLTPGSRLIRPNAALVPSGYTLVGPADVVVSVASNMMPMPASVTFIYARTITGTPVPQAKATIPVYYMSNAGAYINVEYIERSAGVHMISPNSSMVGSAYRLEGANSVYVVVDSNGMVQPSSVTFTYAPVQAATKTNFPVHHKDDRGNEFLLTETRLSEGVNYVQPDSRVPAGYALTSAASVQVTLDSKGKATPSSVTFTYRRAGPMATKNNFPVNHKDLNGRVFLSTEARLTEGTNYVQPDSRVPADYILTSPGSIQVVLDSAGNATPSSATFTYRSSSSPSPSSDGVTGYLPNYVKTKPNSGNYPVYTGPGESYYRVGNATLGGGTIRVYGQDNGWALIGYGLSNGGYRIGFVTLSAIPSDIVQQLQHLQVTYIEKSNVSTSLFVDDPIVSTNRELAKRITAGNTFYLLAYLNDFWAYVEIPNFEGSGRTARGFVSRRSLGV